MPRITLCVIRVTLVRESGSFLPKPVVFLLSLLADG
jgi:hypothetical protein